MLIDENSNELLFFVLKLKKDSIDKICNVIDEKKKQILSESIDLEKQRNENFIIRIIYFKKITNKNSYLISFGTKKNIINYNNESQFLYDDIIKDSSIIEMSIFEKFKFYKIFVENSGLPNLINTFYNDSFKLCLKNTIHLLIFLDVLEHFKGEDEKTCVILNSIILKLMN